MDRPRRTCFLSLVLALGLLLAVDECHGDLSLPTFLPPPVANTTCGPVSGAWVSDSNGHPLAAFLSIPYAEKPLRWKPTVSLDPATCYEAQTRDVSSLPSMCVQSIGIGSEDCLYLQIYVPGNGTFAPTDHKLPVFFYIHGGSLMDGSGIFENPKQFSSSTNSIAVTISYRLNIFGYLATTALSQEGSGRSGNYGFLDQLAALEWIQKNIVYFGGDNSRVTVAGQSSGGTSIFALLSSPRAKGLFSAAIALSGSPNISMSLASAESQNAPITSALRCSFPDWHEEVGCMRAKTVAELVAVIPTAWSTPGIFGIDAFTSGPSRSYYSGLAIVDGTVVTHSFEDAVRHGLVDVPLIMGSMGQEPELMPDQRVRGMTKSAWNALLQTSFASWKNQANSLVADLFLYYQADASLDVQRSYDTLSTDIGLSCALRNIALAGKEGNYSSPIYLYVNQWQPSVPVNGGDWNLTWAFHTWDYTVAFQNWPTATLGSFPQKSDSELNVYLTEAWRQLIYHGRLNASSLNGWKSVEEVSGFPVHYVVQRISSPDLIPYETTSFQEDLKGRICSILHKYEFGSNEWWVN